MWREEFPRIVELRDALPTPLTEGVAFPALDQTIIDHPQKRKFLREIEAELQGLDGAAWVALKAKLTPLPKKDRGRVLRPLYDILNEAKGYNYFVRAGCTNVHFIPASPIKGQKTPDLGGEKQGRQVLCDVKTVNISDEEIDRRRSGGVGTSTDRLNSGFFHKLKSIIENAKAQMLAYDSDPNTRMVVYIIVNYDDSLHEYADRYRSQITQFMSDNQVFGIEVEFDINPPFDTARET